MRLVRGLLILFGVFYGLTTHAKTPTRVTTLPIKFHITSPSQLLQGRVQSRYNAMLATEATGVIESIAEPGKVFKQGEIIAKISDARWRHVIGEQEAEIKRLKAETAFWQSQLKRSEKLFARKQIAEATLDERRLTWISRQEDLVAAEFLKKESERKLAQATIRAPFDGTWVARMKQRGEYYEAGETLGQLVNLTDLELRLSVPAAYLPYIKSTKSLPVSKRHHSDISVDNWPIRTVIPFIKSPISQFDVFLNIPNSASVTAGELIHMSVPKAPQKRYTLVQRDALVHRLDTTLVFTVVEKKAHANPVQILWEKGEWIAVSGLPNDESLQVVVQGAPRLKDGEPVLDESA